MKKTKSTISLQNRNPEKFDIIELYDILGRENKYSLGNKKDEEQFIQKIRDSLSKFMTDTMVYGKRTEALFGYMAASLGQCDIIKKEDCGDIFCESNMLIPDYRLVLKNKKQILVEVKNYYQKTGFAHYSINIDTFNKLLNYSKVMNVELMLAIYWSKWNVWTLNLSSDFIINNKKMKISFVNAVEYNQINILGDFLIATLSPLTIRFYADEKLPRTIEGKELSFTIGSIELFAKNVIITDETEKSIAFNLILYGDWKENIEIVKDSPTGDKIKYIDFSYSPEEEHENQDFSTVGSVSGIISRQYHDLTNSDGNVKSLSPAISKNMLGFIIPPKYVGKALKLWRFHVQPKEKNENKQEV